MTISVQQYDDPGELVSEVARALVGRLQEIQAEGRVPQVVLTGGTIAARVHDEVARTPGDVRWDEVEFWFGDERYVPRGDPDRNAGQAREALLDKIPVDPSKVHEMPASDQEYGDDVETAAQAYGADLVGAAPSEGPWFDVLMLGVGPDGHCASLFPRRAEVEDAAPVLAVRSSPKPPPTRISLGMTTLRRAREVWFVASGSEKAEVVAAAVRGADVLDVPAAGPRGTERTVWFLDVDAARML
ncbi:MAG TPA: 6-phosphogluconolactonase [Nocardioidaceae bacterium]|nr:6-phosphogluconolactonase [Nocardioidaceae bacterium]